VMFDKMRTFNLVDLFVSPLGGVMGWIGMF
jgi:hypothetical protein